MPRRSPCNLKRVEDCTKPTCVPVRRGGSPHHCRSPPRKRSCTGRVEADCKKPGCIPVRREGRYHHCRTPSKPSRQQSSSPLRTSKKKASKKQSPLESAKQKVWNAIRKSSKDCDSFALTQRNGTCFMAASTLMFARVALSECKEESVRRFVRLSMANAWDEAQGPSWNVTCPKIPDSIHEYYRTIYRTSFSPDKIVQIVKGKPDRNDTINGEPTPLGKGGVGSFFLSSLFFASRISCSFTMTTPNFEDSTQEKLSSPSFAKGKTIDEYVHYIIHERLPNTKYNILTINQNRGGYLLSKHVSKLERLLDSSVLSASSHGMKVEGVLMTIGIDGRGHAVSLYPCNRGGIKWVCCNSWGEDCTNIGVPRFVQQVAEVVSIREGSRLKTFTLLLRRV